LNRLPKHFFAIVLCFSLTVSLLGCKDEQEVLEGKVESYNELVNRVNRILIPTADDDIAANPLMQELEKADPAKKAEMALDLADDIAFAQMFGFMTDEVLALAGSAVKAYPHPLLLNNYASLLLGEENTEEALYFFTLALNQEPINPILLTNIANLYIELDDFAAAERYAGMALQTAGDFGPAYQVMTTVHLRNGNHELAAETMVKSAKHVFNDVTIYHFDSFLDAVADLDPAKDDYPLKEAFLVELYEIARANVDVKDVKDDVDTPAGQLLIKPFPMFANTEDLEISIQYIQSEVHKSSELWSEASQEAAQYSSAYSQSKDREADKDGVYPIQFNLRQVYAYRVLESFYRFQLDKARHHFLHDEEQFRKARRERLRIIDVTYQPMYEAAVQKGRDAKSLPAFRSATIEVQQIKLEWAIEKHRAARNYATQLLNRSRDGYNESKQLLEEFWLRSGGLLKYVVEDDLYYVLHGRRKMVVYEYTGVFLGELEKASSELNMKRSDVTIEEMGLAYLMSGKSSPPVEEEKKEGADLAPKIEGGRELDAYPEPGEYFRNLQFGLEKGFFGNDASVASNGKSYEMNIDTIAGTRGWDGNLLTGVHRSYTLHGVKAVGNTMWFTEPDAVQAVLKEGFGEKRGELGKQLGIGFIHNEREGPYMTRRGASKHIMDRGKIYVKETGWSVGEFEKVRKTEKTVSSSMTGYSTTKNTVKYKFAFVSASWDE